MKHEWSDLRIPQVPTPKGRATTVGQGRAPLVLEGLWVRLHPASLAKIREEPPNPNVHEPTILQNMIRHDPKEFVGVVMHVQLLRTTQGKLWGEQSKYLGEKTRGHAT